MLLTVTLHTGNGAAWEVDTVEISDSILAWTKENEEISLDIEEMKTVVISDTTARSLAAEVARLKAQIEAMREAVSALLDSLGTMGLIDDPFIAPDIIDVRAALGGE